MQPIAFHNKSYTYILSSLSPMGNSTDYRFALVAFLTCLSLLGCNLNRTFLYLNYRYLKTHTSIRSLRSLSSALRSKERVSFHTGLSVLRMVLVFFLTLSESGISFILTYGSERPLGSMGIRLRPCFTVRVDYCFVDIFFLSSNVSVTEIVYLEGSFY